MKRARRLVSEGKVLEAQWKPPLLKGRVREGSAAYAAGLLIKNERNIDNLCTCRDSRQWGKICAHSVAVGLFTLNPPTAPSQDPAATPSSKAADPGQLTERDDPRAIPPPSPSTPPPPIHLHPDRGRPLKLHFILPPRWAEGLERNRVSVALEAEWDGKRRPLDGLPLDLDYQMDPRDQALWLWLSAFAGDRLPGVLALDATQFGRLLPALMDHPRLHLGREGVVNVSNEPVRPEVVWAWDDARGLELKLGKPVCASASVPGDPPWIFQSGAFRPMSLPTRFNGLLSGPMRVPPPDVPRWLEEDLPLLEATCALSPSFSDESFQLENRSPEFSLFLQGGLAQLTARLHARYGYQTVEPNRETSPGSAWLPVPGKARCYWRRDFEAERQAIARLWHAGFRGPSPRGEWQLSGQTPVLQFFARHYPSLSREWKVQLEERLERRTEQQFEWIEPRLTISSSGVQWFDLNVAYASAAGEVLPAADVQRLLRTGQGHVRLRNGRTALIDTGAVEEFQECLRDANPAQAMGNYKLASAQAGFLRETARALHWRMRPSQPGLAIPDAKDRKSLPPLALGSLEKVLRPYQKECVAWMHFLRQNGFGGVLADEMGLGKTVQVLALLQTLVQECKQHAKPAGPQVSRPLFLVICPASLLWNWAAEATRFAPDLKTLVWHGPNRQAMEPQLASCDLLITSYTLARKDAERFQSIQWDTLVLDEAQHIKNRQSQNAHAVKSIPAGHRLVLTGTPLENSVLDIWSIFDFLMPGYLGEAREFRERYESPLTRDHDQAVQARLARRLRPFLLRRTKAAVAPELPPKIDQPLFCELTESQQRLYRQVMEASRRELFQEAVDRTEGYRRMLAFNALLRLRQICCDPRLLPTEGPPPQEDSAKIALFRELLDEALDGGHRLLVFSQFTRMLALLRNVLEESALPYCYLDGSTLNRAQVVERFQRDDSFPVFLISLKAGGVGLNLTGADTVVHFDPWWNPAVEDQATDRAHRLGQTRAVTSYRLIARGTVEEKIMTLQKRKRDLIAAALSADTGLPPSLDWDEIQELLS